MPITNAQKSFSALGNVGDLECTSQGAAGSSFIPESSRAPLGFSLALFDRSSGFKLAVYQLLGLGTKDQSTWQIRGIPKFCQRLVVWAGLSLHPPIIDLQIQNLLLPL